MKYQQKEIEAIQDRYTYFIVTGYLYKKSKRKSRFAYLTFKEATYMNIWNMNIWGVNRYGRKELLQTTI